MTQPAPQQPPSLAEFFQVPRTTVVVEKTASYMHLIDETDPQAGTQKKLVVEEKNRIWKVGEAPPDDPTSKIVAMFVAPEGARVYVRPADGSQPAQAGLSFRIIIPRENIAFSMETMNADVQSEEISMDEDRFIFNQDPAPDPGPEPEPTANGAPAVVPGVPAAKAIGEG